MADRGKNRIGRLAVALLASLSVAALACGSSSSLPSAGDGSAGGDASTKRDAATRSDAAAGGDAPTGTDASTPVPDGGSVDASLSSDGGACPLPLAPDLSIIAADEVLKFVAPGGLPVRVAVLPADAAISGAVFQPASSLSLGALAGPTRVLAQSVATGCVPTPFAQLTIRGSL